MRLIRTMEWRRRDRPGYEVCRLFERDSGWSLEGVVSIDGKTIEYSVITDRDWKTRNATAAGREISVDEASRWWAKGRELQHLRGCVDVDLAFTPSTNTLPIRRLGLTVGASASVRAAWLTWPDLDWKVLEQEYERLGEDQYEYRSGGGRFVGRLTVDANGLVLDYGGIWVATGAAAESS